jgi:hypothetical protein
MKARFSNAKLAFLSACNSAAIDVDNTPDEAIHLAAALQFCGFMFRDAGSTGDFRDSAIALNHATREMRKRRVPMDRWINFVHIGA